ncbi:hypothetical protein OG455_19205 [Kitasatospora sp. NBC_01287]|uniref:WXG100 family type VII secretion target n=1 Tax=Kitasatospora sp. NBC_01287 TaxID=2903573 RepID=UPI00225469C3|nr:hypothetical protein [Kitasatospora sp. NBC_01287]MCX4747619.1 hypothetical protein [Kitasatospora sp. NBC_01287]
MTDSTGGGAGFSVHPADILTAAPDFTTQSDRLGSAVTNLESTLKDLGSPWGADDQGKKFGDAYDPRHTALVKSLGVLVQGMASIHLGLEAMAGNHQGTDTTAATSLKAGE